MNYNDAVDKVQVMSDMFPDGCFKDEDTCFEWYEELQEVIPALEEVVGSTSMPMRDLHHVISLMTDGCYSSEDTCFEAWHILEEKVMPTLEAAKK